MKKNQSPLQKKNRPTSSKSNNEHDTHFENIFDRDVNFKERVIYLKDDISEFSLDLILKAFDELERLDPKEPIRIEISSFGGSVYDMLGMVDRMKSSPCHIITRGFGKIMSAATFILAAGDERIIGSRSWVMIHELSDMLPEGKLKTLKNEIKHNQQLHDQMIDMYVEFSKGKTRRSTFKKLAEERDSYLNAQQVMKLGLIEKILES